MTNTNSTNKRVVELIEQARAATTEAERNTLCWEIAIAMEPEVRTRIKRAAAASGGSKRRWRDTDADDIKQETTMRLARAARRLVDRKADDRRPAAYLSGAAKIAVKDAQRTKTKDVMPASTKRGMLERGEKVVEQKRVDDLDWEHHVDERAETETPDPEKLDEHLDERAAVALRIVQQSYPQATLETLSDFAAKILENESRTAKARANARKLAPVGDVTPGEWAWDVEERDERVASQPRTRLDEAVETGTFVTFFGEEVAPPKPKVRPGTHKKRDRSYPQLWDDEQQLPPPEQEGPDLGLAM